MMTPDQSLEYQKLRDEYSLLANMIATTVTFSVGGCMVLFGYLLDATPRIFLFALPLLIIYPSCLIIISILQSIIRLATYINVFLEPQGDLKYETRYLNFKVKSKDKLVFSLTILLIYFALIAIDIALFITKNFTSTRDFFIYGTSIILFIPIIRIIRIDWRTKYIKYWEKVKAEETQETSN
ncbi:MAG: hypothetical protein K2P85_00910 [Flavobacteriaceae bacterium]|nr:hypothetical protein [Flavobacteriaceae bacterium]